jgi:two-component system sensor histidine kinase DesK
MSALAVTAPPPAPRAPRHRLADPRLLLVVAHVGVLAPSSIIASFGVLGAPPAAHPAVVLPIGAANIALQLRHSLALAAGRRPRAAWLTVVLQAVLICAPLPWFGWGWVYLVSCVVVSARLVVGPRAVLALGALVLAGDVVVDLVAERAQDASLAVIIYAVVYDPFAILVDALVLYGSARLVAALDELGRTRGELAELAVGRERLRVSRDLHDLLGQSLSAISLKGDLAVRLLDRDPRAALAEVADLTEVARSTLAGVRAVTRDEHAVSLRTELDGAVALLTAAHIAADVRVEPLDLSPAAEDVLAWALREAVTNVLRHSRATTCAVGLVERDGDAHLSIHNDGAEPTATAGAGLTGLVERARALSGTAEAGPDGAGGFRLCVRLPLAAR